MMRSLCILGRQPALGLAELESLYGADKIQPLGSQAVLVDVDPCLLAFDRLGGCVKFCKVLTELPTTNWSDIEKFLVEVSPDHASGLPDGKMRLGLSVYDFKFSPKRIMASGLTLKKAIVKSGRSVRLVPNSEAALSSAQVMHNQLTGPLGWELIFVRRGNKTTIAQSVKVQDINSYTLRDRGRPKRDARVGMLPPKLAQIIINLAVGELPEESKQSICEIPPDEPIPQLHFDGTTILDPFCGTGVILQEALLMGYEVIGSDLEKRMVDYTDANLDWLKQKYPDIPYFELETGDATAHTWMRNPTVVASETYLGKPFTTAPPAEVLSQTINEVNTITTKFLKNLARQTSSGLRLCLAVPAWKKSPARSINASTMQGKSEPRTEPYMKYGEGAEQFLTTQRTAKASGVAGSAGQQAGLVDDFWHLPVLDQLTDMGYNRLSFVHARKDQLIYHRPDQFVGRELIVLTRK